MGLALTKTLVENVQLWNTMRDSLVWRNQQGVNSGGQPQSNQGGQQQGNQPRNSNSGGGPRFSTATKQKSSFKGKGAKGGGKGSRDAFKFAVAAQGETPFCRKWNDRQCDDNACRFVHKCNALLISTGRACGSSSHGRCKHDSSRHGAAQTRE